MVVTPALLRKGSCWGEWGRTRFRASGKPGAVYSQRTPKQVAATAQSRQVRSRPRTRYRMQAAWP